MAITIFSKDMGAADPGAFHAAVLLGCALLGAAVLLTTLQATDAICRARTMILQVAEAVLVMALAMRARALVDTNRLHKAGPRSREQTDDEIQGAVQLLNERTRYGWKPHSNPGSIRDQLVPTPLIVFCEAWLLLLWVSMGLPRAEEQSSSADEYTVYRVCSSQASDSMLCMDVGMKLVVMCGMLFLIIWTTSPLSEPIRQELNRVSHAIVLVIAVAITNAASVVVDQLRPEQDIAVRVIVLCSAAAGIPGVLFCSLIYMANDRMVERMAHEWVVDRMANGRMVDRMAIEWMVERMTNNTMVKRMAYEWVVERMANGRMVERMANGWMVERMANGWMVERMALLQRDVGEDDMLENTSNEELGVIAELQALEEKAKDGWFYRDPKKMEELRGLLEEREGHKKKMLELVEEIEEVKLDLLGRCIICLETENPQD
eukprot:gene15219-18002_t